MHLLHVRRVQEKITGSATACIEGRRLSSVLWSSTRAEHKNQYFKPATEPIFHQSLESIRLVNDAGKVN